MTPNKRKSPLTDTGYAWRVTVNPMKYSKSDRKLLIKRAIDTHYTTESDEIDQHKLLTEVAEVVSKALDRPSLKRVIRNPPNLIEHPGKTTLLMSFASVLPRRNNVIQKSPQKPKIHQHIREYFRYVILAAAKQSNHNSTIRKQLGELVYSRKQEDKYGPPPGETIEGITELSGFSKPFFKIPLVHANRYCISRATTTDGQGELTCVINGPYVYVPVSDAVGKYEREFSSRNGVAHQHEKMIHLSISDDRLDQYQQKMTGMNKRIEELNNQNSSLLFQERQYPPMLEAILRSIDEADVEQAAIGDELTAKEVYNVAQEYASSTETEWIRNLINNIDSTKSLSQQLAQYATNDDIQHVTVEQRDGNPNLYQFEYSIGGVKKIDVEEISDLLELPCMQSLHESLQNGTPVRWELYSFVRYVFEIHTTEFTVDDIKEWFSQYDWYREEVTEYQANYEKDQRMADGNRPLPISCRNDNDNWATHCIGMENCEYSLYRSVELKPDVYDRAGNG